VLFGVAGGQEPAVAAGGTPAPPAAAADDEVIVRGRRPEQLRVEIERAENAFYERFNAVNSDDEYDIVCRYQAVTGSRVPRRICEPEYELAAQAQAGQQEVLGLQGSAFGGGSGQFAGMAHYKHQLLEEEIRKAVSEDPKLLEALTRLLSLQQAYKDSQKK
jgi:hypothetical protein